MKCPFCGGENEDQATSCNWCHAELVDQSQQHYEAKKSQAVTKTKELIQVPHHIVHLVIGIIFLLALVLGIGGTLLSIHEGYDLTDIASLPSQIKAHRLDQKLKDYYRTQNYQALEQLLINDVEQTISSKYYMAYRTALFVHWYSDDFKQGQKNLELAHTYDEKNNAIYEMCNAYMHLTKEQHEHEEPTCGYRTIDEIESKLDDEIDYQTTELEHIIDFDLKTLKDKSDATLKSINWNDYLLS